MSEIVNDINKIKIESSLTLSNVNMTTLLFSDNLISPKDTYTIVDNMLILKTQPQSTLELFEFVDSSRYYEFLMNLNTKGVVISGTDRYSNVLSNLSDTVLVFVNGYKLSSEEYIIDSVNNSITIKSNFTEKPLSNIVIYTSADMVYEGNVEEDFSWDPNYNQFTLKDYTVERYIFFKNGELLSPNKIQKISDKVRLNTTVKHGVDFVEYYRMTRDCCALIFEPEFGYLTYGPKDTRDNLIQNPYDCMLTFDNITRLLIDDVRTGFFVHEENTDGCVMIVDDNFEGCSVKCLKIRDFTKKMLSSDEYFLRVPDAPSILKYVSQYDLNGVLFKELLASFQKVLLNETYDSIQRLKNIRNINKVDSSNICALINFLGLKINVTDLTLAKKHHLVEELRTFYDKVGTRASYNFYNAIKNEGKILNIEQLFTPIKSNVIDKRKDSFFPAQWGALQYVRQTVSNDETNKSYLYIWSFRFANGYTLPVVIRNTTNNPEWNFGYAEKTEKTIYNSATYDTTKRSWVNTVAQNKETEMVWLREGEQLDSKNMLLAKKQHWDEGHLVGNHPSVTTERYNFIIGEETLTIIDTYIDLTIGTWKLYKENITPQVVDPVRRYVTFRTAEELGASYKERYETETVDFGAVSELAENGTNLSNTPRFSGELRYAGFPMLAEGVIDRYYPTENGPELRRDSIVFPLTMNSNTHFRNITEDSDYECEIDENNQKIVLTRYIGNDSHVIVPETVTYQQKKVVDFSSTPTNLRITLYDNNNKRVALYEYVAETNTYTYILDESVAIDTYHYKVFDTNNNLLIEDVLQEGDYTYSTLLPLANTYLTNPMIGPNQPSIDCGFISDEHPVDFYDFGSVAEQIEGHWVSWYEWDRPKNWYPTNHVDISVESPVNMSYNDFMTLFRDTFYEMASAVLYIHQLTQIYMFNEPGEFDGAGGADTYQMSLITSSNYSTIEHCFTNDHEFLPYKKATDARPLELKSYMFSNPTYEFGEPNLHKYIVDFPSKWGHLDSITQSVIPYYNSWAYIWSLKFKDDENNVTGILPVFLDRVSLIPTFDFRYYEDLSENQQRSIPNYNSALWIDNEKRLINYQVTDGNDVMIWSRTGYPTVSIENESAKLINWNEGHLNNNEPTSITNRFEFTISDKTIGVSDTYGQLASTDLNVSLDITKRYEYINKINENDETFEWTDTVSGILPCIQCNYTDWVGENDSLEIDETNAIATEGTCLPNFTVTCTPIIITDNNSQIKHDWLYALVINYQNKDIAYTISKDLQQVNLVAQNTSPKKIQTVINGKIECVRPNSVYYTNNQWTFGYATYDKNNNIFQWKLATLDKNIAEDEPEQFGLGIGEYDYESLSQQSCADHWNCDRYGEVLVNTKAEIENNKFLVYICTNKNESGASQEYYKVESSFDLETHLEIPTYSYQKDNIFWSCDFKKYLVSNNAILSDSNKTNASLILLPNNIVYEDKNTNIKCQFQNKFDDINYHFAEIGSTLSPMKEQKTETEKSSYYKYTNTFASILDNSQFLFNTYGMPSILGKIVFTDIDYLMFGFDHLPGHGKHLDLYVRIANSSNDQYNRAVGRYSGSGEAKVPNTGQTLGAWETDLNYDPNCLMQWCRHNQGEHEGSPYYYTIENVIVNLTNFANEPYKNYFTDVIRFDLYCAFNSWNGGVEGLVSPHDVSIILRGYKNGNVKYYKHNEFREHDIYQYDNVDDNGNPITPKYGPIQHELENVCITEAINVSIPTYLTPETYTEDTKRIIRKVAIIEYTQSTKRVTVEIVPKQDS